MKNFLWVDLEMTGLDETKDQILEVAAVVTDAQFKVLEEYHRIVFQPPEVLALMDDWCQKTHGQSGLTKAVATGTPLTEVEQGLLQLIQNHFPAKERVVLVGNSIGNDRKFIDRYMPLVAQKLHYRLVDVSSFKEIFRERYGVQFQKANAHRAVDDIHASIAELETYLSYVQVKDAPGEKPGSEGGKK